MNPDLSLPATAVDALNIMGGWLARQDSLPLEDTGLCDVIVLAGNAVIPTIDAALRLAAVRNEPLVITGGIGHSTALLYHAVEQDTRYARIPTAGRPEALILRDMATQYWGISATRILLETASTNCGENARYTRNLLDQMGMKIERGILIQDPTMQRRTHATFQHTWQQVSTVPEWFSFPGYIPQLTADDSTLLFVEACPGLWSPERYIALVCGEFTRIEDTPEGYGPQGRNFMVRIDIPEPVLSAWEMIKNHPAIHFLLADRVVG